MLADASIGKIYFLNMWDDSAFRTYLTIALYRYQA